MVELVKDHIKDSRVVNPNGYWHRIGWIHPVLTFLHPCTTHTEQTAA